MWKGQRLCPTQSLLSRLTGTLCLPQHLLSGLLWVAMGGWLTRRESMWDQVRTVRALAWTPIKSPPLGPQTHLELGSRKQSPCLGSHGWHGKPWMAWDPTSGLLSSDDGYGFYGDSKVYRGCYTVPYMMVMVSMVISESTEPVTRCPTWAFFFTCPTPQVLTNEFLAHFNQRTTWISPFLSASEHY